MGFIYYNQTEIAYLNARSEWSDDTDDDNIAERTWISTNLLTSLTLAKIFKNII